MLERLQFSPLASLFKSEIISNEAGEKASLIYYLCFFTNIVKLRISGFYEIIVCFENWWYLARRKSNHETFHYRFHLVLKNRRLINSFIN